MFKEFAEYCRKNLINKSSNIISYVIEDYTKQYDQYLEGNLDKITPISPEEIEHLHQIELKQQLSTNKEQEKKNEEERNNPQK